MNRRETLRNLLLSGLVGSGLLQSCRPENEGADARAEVIEPAPGYGRTPAEKKRDAELMEETFFRPDEMATLAVLTNMIVPADERSGSATDAGVPDFIEFIAKDIPTYQLPLRGGLAWLNTESNRRFDKRFTDASETERRALLDDIAYPDPALEVQPFGTQFFTVIRFLTLTGFYTSEMGVKDDLGYAGNVPNQWDGIPADELAAHGMAYDPAWEPHFLDIETRHELAQWDAEGKLVS